MAPTDTPLRIGVIYSQVQMTDLAPIDIIGGLSTKAISSFIGFVPGVEDAIPRSTPMEFLYISSAPSPSSPIPDDSWVTPSMVIRPTHTYANAPRDLDIIVIGGPDVRHVSEESLDFLREASLQTKVILTTCTGAMWLARSGVLDGKKATTNRMLLDVARQGMPNVKWQDQRWVVEEGRFEGAKIWTSGGAGCGIDMTFQYMKENFDNTLVDLCATTLAFDASSAGHGQLYSDPTPITV
ncbi:class I glutamine amidotransferase-like protein [Dendryphion nanum]|uniref:Class I glutamine amidotransferase-like protein n=1 Tax=Dendryphion nanum TaxID=256645 RepID=A0A9P9IZA9_9PLEO|nr:class I glutamine amidotransferase-like protein [Dendryphion nanum]